MTKDNTLKVGNVEMMNNLATFVDLFVTGLVLDQAR